MSALARTRQVYAVSFFISLPYREVHVEAEVDAITRAVVILGVTSMYDARFPTRETLSPSEIRDARDVALRTVAELWAAK